MIAVAQSGGQDTSIDRNGADELPSDSKRLGKSLRGPVALAESATDAVSQFHWGTRELAGETNGRGDAVSHVLRRDAAAMWKGDSSTFPNYILATRHVFWWGDNGDHRKLRCRHRCST